ncbi:MAG TPA: hypothetical protein VF609_07480 [Flavisolibacter sp.]|jgi:hypothetical protein
MKSVKPPEELLAEFQGKLQEQSTIVNSDEAISEEKQELDEGRIHELQKKALELQLLKAQIRKFEDDNEGRREFSRSIFLVTVIWMFLVLMIVLQCARGKWGLSDSVLIALITTTTATVIGIFIIVANYLFNRDKST